MKQEPIKIQGFWHQRTEIDDSTGKLEKSLAEYFAEENVPKQWLNMGHGLLQDLFIESFMFRANVPPGLKPRKHILTDDERMVAATLIQWLGTNCGRWFLRDAFEKAGWEISFKSPEEIEREKLK